MSNTKQITYNLKLLKRRKYREKVFTYKGLPKKLYLSIEDYVEFSFIYNFTPHDFKYMYKHNIDLLYNCEIIISPTKKISYTKEHIRDIIDLMRNYTYERDNYLYYDNFNLNMYEEDISEIDYLAIKNEAIFSHSFQKDLATTKTYENYFNTNTSNYKFVIRPEKPKRVSDVYMLPKWFLPKKKNKRTKKRKKVITVHENLITEDPYWISLLDNNYVEHLQLLMLSDKVFFDYWSKITKDFLSIYHKLELKYGNYWFLKDSAKTLFYKRLIKAYRAETFTFHTLTKYCVYLARILPTNIQPEDFYNVLRNILSSDFYKEQHLENIEHKILNVLDENDIMAFTSDNIPIYWKLLPLYTLLPLTKNNQYINKRVFNKQNSGKEFYANTSFLDNIFTERNTDVIPIIS